MRHICLVLVLALSLSHTLPLSAGEGTGKSASERLQAQVPDGWIKGVDKNLPNLQVTEYFPADTQIEWQQKLSFEAMSGEGLPDPIEFTQGMIEQQAEFCDDFVENGVYSGFENGYPTMVHILECRKNKRTGKPLVTMIKAIKGNAALYVITRIWRLQPPPAQLPEEQQQSIGMPLEEIAAWSTTLANMSLCDPQLPAHPCADTNTTSLDSNKPLDATEDRNPTAQSG